MKRIHLSRTAFISVTMISFMAMPSYAALVPTAKLAQDCEDVPPDPTSSSIFDSRPYQTRDGNTINVLSLKNDHTKGIVVILRNHAAPGDSEVPRIVAVCLDRQKDAWSNNGNIVFSGEKGARVPILFRLVGFKTVRWVQPAEKALALVQTDAPNQSVTLVAGDVPSCLVPPPVAATARDLRILMCEHTASYDFYYVYGLYMNQTGHPKPIEIDPQIIHHPS